MGGSAGDEQKTTEKMPAWLEDAVKKGLAQGEKVSKIGYVPYIGPDVAAFTPQQVAGMQSAADWSAAFDTPGQAAPSVEASLMPATDFGGGLRGYSSFGGYQDALAALEQQYPGMANYLKSFFINPVTGAQPTGGTGTPTPTPGGGSGGGGGGGGGGSGGGGGITPSPPRDSWFSTSQDKPAPIGPFGKWVPAAGGWQWVVGQGRGGTGFIIPNGGRTGRGSGAGAGQFPGNPRSPININAGGPLDPNSGGLGGLGGMFGF